MAMGFAECGCYLTIRPVEGAAHHSLERDIILATVRLLREEVLVCMLYVCFTAVFFRFFFKKIRRQNLFIHLF